MSGRHVRPGLQSFYSADQVQTYLQRVNFVGDASSFEPNLKNLEQLVRLHLVAFTFENSRLHYAANHEVDVSPEYVYNRLVERRLGGSWCCGHNGLFLGMLRGLGYRVYASSGRMSLSPPSQETKAFGFLTHMVLFVQLDKDGPSDVNAHNVLPNSKTASSGQQTYLVDVGYGGPGLVRPMLLEAGHIVPGSAPPEEHRLVRIMHPESSFDEIESLRQWELQYRCGSHSPAWTTICIFAETEMYVNDWIAYSQWFSAHPVDVFLTNVLAVRHFIVESTAGDEALLGRLVMKGRKVQRRIGTQSETIREFHTESERVRSLMEDFGITVDETEVCNINTLAALTP